MKEMKLIRGNVTRAFSGYKPIGLTGAKEQVVTEAFQILTETGGCKVFHSTTAVWTVDGATKTISRRMRDSETPEVFDFS